MKPTLRNITRLHKVVETNLFMTTGKLDYPRIRDASTRLLNLVAEYDGDGAEDSDLWSIGEFGHCSMDSLVIALFWHSIDYIDGSSTAAMALNTAANAVFSPGMSDGPEPETSENDAYESLNTIADTYYNPTSQTE